MTGALVPRGRAMTRAVVAEFTDNRAVGTVTLDEGTSWISVEGDRAPGCGSDPWG